MPDCSHGKFLMKPEQTFHNVLAKFREKLNKRERQPITHNQCNVVLLSK